MNTIVRKLAIEEPRFKGKISVVAHSLGSVIGYDLLTRQKWENFRMGEPFTPQNGLNEESQ